MRENGSDEVLEQALGAGADGSVGSTGVSSTGIRQLVFTQGCRADELVDHVVAVAPAGGRSIVSGDYLGLGASAGNPRAVVTGFAEDADATLLRRRMPFGEPWTDRYEETR